MAVIVLVESAKLSHVELPPSSEDAGDSHTDLDMDVNRGDVHTQDRSRKAILGPSW